MSKYLLVLKISAKIKPLSEKGFIFCLICCRFCALSQKKENKMISVYEFFSTYSEGETPKCLRKMVEK